MNYAGNLQVATQSTASTTITYELMFYYSNMFEIAANGDWIVYGKSYKALDKATILNE